MLSNRENLDIMLVGNSLDREESVYSNLGRRPESPSYENLLNQMINRILILEKRRLEDVLKMAIVLEKPILVASLTDYQAS